MDSLWGNDFDIVSEEKVKTKKILDKISLSVGRADPSADKIMKSKKVSIDEKLIVARDNVYRILGKQVNNVETIRTRERLHEYLSKGLTFGRIAIDTETNNSLDPITCKLMGLCLYVKGEKQAYVPVNHIDRASKKRLENQLTEEEIHDELQWLINNKGECKFVFHNGKFDYEVLKCTCHVECPIDWDTMIGAKLLDENETSAGLKWQYSHHIDPSQEKYDIENLFEHLPYEIIEPELFAVYSGTDSYMTDRLYEYQQEQFHKPGMERVLDLALSLEMPVIKVFAEMELNGISFDKEYDRRLSEKYHKKLTDIDARITEELFNMKPLIDEWRQSKEANTAKVSASGNTGKTKNQQLTDPINLSSPTQLAILFYDVLKLKPVSSEAPRGTGEEVLAKMDLPLAKLLLERRGYEKLLSAFIDALPNMVNVDGKIHCDFNQMGAKTGRTSCIAKGMKISMDSGYKRIEDVKVGDRVRCYDTKKKRETVKEVKGVYCNGKRDLFVEIFFSYHLDDYFDHCLTYGFELGYDSIIKDSLVCTPEHKIYTLNRGWIKACQLTIDDKIAKEGGGYITPIGLEVIDDRALDVYDLEVEDVHNFYASGLCVHNCSNPNLQQIPSHEKSIRLLFRACPNHTLVGSDYSQQEVRTLAALAKDKRMIEAYNAGKDIYATVASMVYKNKYEDNLEHYPDGSINVEGKKRRSNCKSIVLGLNYGRGTGAISQQIGESFEDTQKIVDEYFKSFPNILKLRDSSQEKARKLGYVEDAWGRRRHLPDISLPKYEVIDKKASSTFNPFLICKDRKSVSKKAKTYEDMLKEARGRKEINKIIQEAEKDGIEVKDNSSLVSTAERQCLNSVIQGCLSGDSIIYTSDGAVSIESVCDKNICVWDGKNWSSAVVVKSGKKQKCILTTSMGDMIVCSPDHRFLVCNTYGTEKYKKFSELTKSYRLIVEEDYPKMKNKFSIKELYPHHLSTKKIWNRRDYSFDDIKDDYTRGQVLGRIASDGSYKTRKRLGGTNYVYLLVAEHEKDLLDYFKRVLPYKYTIRCAQKKNQKLYEIVIHSKTLADECEQMDIKRDIPDVFFTNIDLLRGFISGFFDGDGTCLHNYISLDFGRQEDFSNMLIKFKKALNMLGINNKLHEYKDRYRVTISNYSADLFISRVGFISKEKQNAVLSVCPKKTNKTFNFRHIVGIKSIQITDEYIDMYDICNTKRGCFVVNGLVTHNSSASMTKKAMLDIYNDKELNELGFKLLINVHDELIGECPKENAQRCAERLEEVMKNAAMDVIPIKQKCDASIVEAWYQDELGAEFKEDLGESMSKGMTKEDALQEICEEHSEFDRNQIEEMIDSAGN